MFEKGLNPVDSLGLGRRAKIKEWLEPMNINDYKIIDDYSININGDVDLRDKKLAEIPDFIQFNIVHGNFWCDNNKLKSLKGCPKIVKGSFSCTNNPLKSLDYLPDKFTNLWT